MQQVEADGQDHQDDHGQQFAPEDRVEHRALVDQVQAQHLDQLEDAAGAQDQRHQQRHLQRIEHQPLGIEIADPAEEVLAERLPVRDDVGDDADERGEPEDNGRGGEAPDAVADQFLERRIEIDEDRQNHEADDNDPVSKRTHAFGILRHGSNGVRLLKRPAVQHTRFRKKSPDAEAGRPG